MPDAVDDGIAVGVPPVPEEGPGEPVGLSDPVEGILTDTAALAAERDEYLLALQHLQADFENYKKRVQRQQEEQSARAALDLVGKILPVLDTLDLARAHRESTAENGESHDAEALDQARSQLLDLLMKEGLERVDASDVPFDPSVHDAVAAAPHDDSLTESTERDAGTTIDEVLRAGYRWRGQVLRPAMVRVRG